MLKDIVKKEILGHLLESKFLFTFDLLFVVKMVLSLFALPALRRQIEITDGDSKESADLLSARDETQGARSAGTESYIEICRGYEYRATQRFARTGNKSAFSKGMYRIDIMATL